MKKGAHPRRKKPSQDPNHEADRETAQGARTHVFFAPGRVNLIGEHTDYNGGLVLPIAISKGVYVSVTYTKEPGDKKAVMRLKSTDAPGEACVEMAQLPEISGNRLSQEAKSVSNSTSNLSANSGSGQFPGWAMYPIGVAKYLLREGYSLPGCDIQYLSTMPLGAGLSSSAALELVTAYALLWPTLKETKMDRLWLARLCQTVENEFIGVNCGIMDQFAVAMGKMDHAMLLDCSTLNWSYVPFDLGDYSLVIMYTGKRRSLGESLYNHRRQECEKALELIRKDPKYAGVPNLCSLSDSGSACEVTNDILKDLERILVDEDLRKRARHVITENLRTAQAVRCLKEADILGFGRLMIESQRSLKEDYEVTGFELDTIVEEALSVEDCIGARMTGAGFGGCAIALVRPKAARTFINKVSWWYQKKTGLRSECFTSTAEDGVRHIGDPT